MAKIAQRKYPLPPTSKKSFSSIDSSHQAENFNTINSNRVCLPSLKSPEITSQKQQFVLSLFEVKGNKKSRPHSLVRNSSKDPFQFLVPLDANIKIPKIINSENIVPKFWQQKSGTTRRFEEHLFSSDKENKHENMEDPTPKFMGGFYETFSKNGNIRSSEPFGSPKICSNQKVWNPEIEINRLDSETESEAFSRSTPENDYERPRNYTKSVQKIKLNTNERSTKLQFDTNCHSDNEAMRKTALKTRKIFKKGNIKYLPGKRISKLSVENSEIKSAKNWNLAKDLQKLRVLQPILFIPGKLKYKGINHFNDFIKNKN